MQPIDSQGIADLSQATRLVDWYIDYAPNSEGPRQDGVWPRAVYGRVEYSEKYPEALGKQFVLFDAQGFTPVADKAGKELFVVVHNGGEPYILVNPHPERPDWRSTAMYHTQLAHLEMTGTVSLKGGAAVAKGEGDGTP